MGACWDPTGHCFSRKRKNVACHRYAMAFWYTLKTVHGSTPLGMSQHPSVAVKATRSACRSFSSEMTSSWLQFSAQRPKMFPCTFRRVHGFTFGQVNLSEGQLTVTGMHLLASPLSSIDWAVNGRRSSVLLPQSTCI